MLNSVSVAEAQGGAAIDVLVTLGGQDGRSRNEGGYRTALAGATVIQTALEHVKTCDLQCFLRAPEIHATEIATGCAVLLLSELF